MTADLPPPRPSTPPEPHSAPLGVTARRPRLPHPASPAPDGRSASRSSRKHIWFGLGGVGIGLVLGLGTVGGILGINALAERNQAAAQQDAIAEAYAGCGLESVDGAYLADDGQSIDLSGVSLWSRPAWADMTCVGDNLDMPDSVELRMQQTRALDGTQHAEWGPYSVSWTYHPDDGLGTVFEYTGNGDAGAQGWES